MATASSGWTPLDGGRPKNRVSRSWMAGMRVWPPTSMTLSISPVDMPASVSTRARISMLRSSSGSVSCSSSARSTCMSMLSGCPCGVMVMKGIEKGASSREERSILVRSARSLMRCMATGSEERSTACLRRKSART